MARLTAHDAGGPPVDHVDAADAPGRTRRFLADVARLSESCCAHCGRALCGHDAVACVVLGLRDVPTCTAALAADSGEEAAALRARVWQYVRRHDCFHAGWRAANLAEGRDADAGLDCRHNLDAASSVGASLVEPVARRAAAHAWNAGDMACGELLMELRRRMRALPPGASIRVTALDPAAPEDIPAWCRLTGHVLVAAAHPDYEIRSDRE